VQVKAEAFIQQSGHVLDLHTEAHARHAIFASSTEYSEQQRSPHPVPSEFLAHPDPELRRSLVDEPSQMIGAGPQSHPGRADTLPLPVGRDHRQIPEPPPTLERLGQLRPSQCLFDRRSRRRGPPVSGLEQHLTQELCVIRARSPNYQRFYPIFVGDGHPAG